MTHAVRDGALPGAGFNEFARRRNFLQATEFQGLWYKRRRLKARPPPTGDSNFPPVWASQAIGSEPFFAFEIRRGRGFFPAQPPNPDCNEIVTWSP
jgi:hypothetical protein